MNDDFYIGWQQKAPTRTGKIVRTSIFVLFSILVIGSAALAFSQKLIGRSVFEWGKIKEFTGTLNASPVPHLVVTNANTMRSYYLVRPWKFGFEPKLAEQFDRQHVRLRGTLIYRDDQAMIEVERDSVSLEGRVTRPDQNKEMGTRGTRPSNDVVSLGERTFVGEIVDSKCFLGVMNPGQLKPHRACAARCISGGVPPVLLVRETNGTARYLLLLSREGKPVNRDVLELVAEPVRITGELVREEDMLVLRSDPSTYRRL